jgi:hypothetical protein
MSVADLAYYEAMESGLLGFNESEVDLDIIDFAGFLHEKPGVRRVWQTEEQRLRHYRRLVLPDEQRSTWSDRVEAKLAVFDETGAISPSTSN